MSDRIAVARLGPDRVRIDGARRGSRSATELVDWLASRTDVTDVNWRERSGSLEVRYRSEPAPAVGFVRALEDRVHAMQTPPAAVFDAEIVHSLPGRARIRFTGTDDDGLRRRAAALANVPGVLRANPSPASHSILVAYDVGIIDEASVLDRVRSLDAATMPPAPVVPRGPDWIGTAINTAVFAACATGALPVPVLSAGIAYTAIPPVRRAVRALRDRHVTVDLLDVTAIGISLATGQPMTAAFITWLLGLGDLLLEHSADRARRAITSLMDLDAPDAFRLEGEVVTRVSADRLRVGDLVVVEAGRRVPADGVVRSGVAMIDEKALTGESEPREKNEGARVMAATVVVEGQIVMAVERTGSDTTAAQIVKILEGAGGKPMTLQRDAERVADRLVLPTFGVAGIAAGVTAEIERATSVLITDFGTGIRIAIPTTALSWMAVAAREGVLVKGAQYLERLAKADVIVFDKTGTLTSGHPEVVDVTTFGGFDVRDIVAWCAAAEQRQHHPIAQAIRRHAEGLEVAVPHAEFGSERHRVGFGLSSVVAGRAIVIGNARWMREHSVDPEPATDAVARHASENASSLYVAVDGTLAAVIAYADRPREESAAIIHALRANGRRRVVLLSGDTDGPVRAVAAALGIDEARGDLLPEDKAAYVREAQREGHVVAMVGDGINDAPALAHADVGISLHGGTDVALETADVLLLEGGLERLPRAFEIGDRTMRAIRWTLGLVIAPNAVAIGLGAAGLLQPAAAAIVNNGSTVLAALAALSPLALHRRKPKRVEPRDPVKSAIHKAAGTAGVLAAVLSPIPLADEIVFLPVYALLAKRIGSAHGLEFRALPWRAIALTAVSGLTARATLNLAVSFVPGVAAVANAASAVTLTEFFGRFVDDACRRPANASPLGVKDVLDALRATWGFAPKPS